MYSALFTVIGWPKWADAAAFIGRGSGLGLNKGRCSVCQGSPAYCSCESREIEASRSKIRHAVGGVDLMMD